MTLLIVIKTANQPSSRKELLGDRSDYTCFSGYPLVAISAVRRNPGPVFTDAAFLQSPLPSRGHFPLLPYDDPQPRSQVRVNFCHCCLHGGKGEIVNPSSQYLIDTLDFLCNFARLVSTCESLQFCLAFWILTP